MDDNISGILKLIFFLLIFAGGIASDFIRKNKAKKRAEAEERYEEEAEEDDEYDGPPIPEPAPRRPDEAARAQRPAIGRNDDSEWLSTLAGQKRRDAAKAAAKSAAKAAALEYDKSDAFKLSPPQQQQTPFALSLSAEKAKEGFILAEILGPPVSMR